MLNLKDFLAARFAVKRQLLTKEQAYKSLHAHEQEKQNPAWLISLVKSGLVSQDEARGLHTEVEKYEYLRAEGSYASAALAQNIPAPEIEAARQQQKSSNFAKRLGVLLQEKGVVSADQHSKILDAAKQEFLKDSEARLQIVRKAYDEGRMAGTNSSIPVPSPTRALEQHQMQQRLQQPGYSPAPPYTAPDDDELDLADGAATIMLRGLPPEEDDDDEEEIDGAATIMLRGLPDDDDEDDEDDEVAKPPPPINAGYGAGQGFQNQGFQGGFQNQGFQNQGFQNQGYQNQGFQGGFQHQGFQSSAPPPLLGGGAPPPVFGEGSFGQQQQAATPGSGELDPRATLPAGMIIDKNADDPYGDMDDMGAMGAMEPADPEVVKANQKLISDDMVAMALASKYKLKKLLGQGQMGQVFLAESLKRKSEVALKLAKPKGRNAEDVIARFKREIIVTDRVKNPHVVEVYDSDELPDGTHYMAMEVLVGQELKKYLEDKGAFDADTTCDLILQILDGLKACHQAEVVHRDIKPENMHVSERDGKLHLCLVDFGLARLLNEEESNAQQIFMSVATQVSGSPRYMAPESITDPDKVDYRCDLYAVGVTMFELFTGEVPFSGKDKKKVLEHQLYSSVPLLEDRVEGKSFPRSFETVIRKLMEKERDLRFQTCDEVIEALTKVRKELKEGPKAGQGSKTKGFFRTITSLFGRKDVE